MTFNFSFNSSKDPKSLTYVSVAILNIITPIYQTSFLIGIYCLLGY